MMNKFLLCCSFTFIGWAIAQQALGETTINDLIERVKYLEERLETIENDPLAAYFPDPSEDYNTDGTTKRDINYAHSGNKYANSTFVFCGSSSQKRSVIQSSYSSSYENQGNGTFIVCGGHGSTPRLPSGVSYVVWGKQYCPNGQTLYSGVLGGNYVRHSAGGSGQVCLPDSPEYGTYASGAQQKGRMYPGKYETKAYSHLTQYHGKLIRCAACYNDDSSTLLMIPAAVSCPSEWNQEYTGYLMTQPDIAGYYRYIQTMHT